MVGEKWRALPNGTKVRMTCDYGGFMKWQIVTRRHTKRDDSDTVYFVDYNTDYYGNHLSDYQWELIDDKEEIKERLPTQGDKIQVKNEWWTDWSCTIKTFVCFYNGKVIAEDPDSGFELWWQWRFPPQEEVTLSDGKTYLVEERDWIKCLVEKQ